jgi:hypothetical protein
MKRRKEGGLKYIYMCGRSEKGEGLKNIEYLGRKLSINLFHDFLHFLQADISMPALVPLSGLA